MSFKIFVNGDLVNSSPASKMAATVTAKWTNDDNDDDRVTVSVGVCAVNEAGHSEIAAIKVNRPQLQLKDENVSAGKQLMSLHEGTIARIKSGGISAIESEPVRKKPLAKKQWSEW
jgi:hypothetical protein